MNSRAGILSSAAVLAVLVPASASASAITFTYSGLISSSTVASAPVGTGFSATYSFDSAAADLFPGLPLYGAYALTGSSMTLGATTWTAGGGHHSIDLVSDGAGGYTSTYFVGGYTSLLTGPNLIDGNFVGFWELRLESSAGNPFSDSDANPLLPPSLAAFSTTGFNFITSSSGAVGTVSSLNLVTNGASVPEPASMLLVGAGLVGAVRRLRRRAQSLNT